MLNKTVLILVMKPGCLYLNTSTLFYVRLSTPKDSLPDPAALQYVYPVQSTHAPRSVQHACDEEWR